MFNKNSFPFIVITQEMIDKAQQLIPTTQVNRTVASKIDTLTGHLGEFVFAQWFYNDWTLNNVGNNKGEVDFPNIEIKTSAFPFNPKLNLLVRQDYAHKRKPAFYIQIIIDTTDPKASEIKAGTKAFLCGFASAEMVDQAPLRDFGSKLANKGGYQCHYINILDLKPLAEFKK